MEFNTRYSLYLEQHDDLKTLSLMKKIGKDPIQGLLDDGWTVSPYKPGVVIAPPPNGKAYDLPDLYKLIMDYLKRQHEQRK